MESIHKALSYELVRIGNFHISTYHIFALILLWLIVKLVLWSIKKIIRRRAKLNKIDEGRSHAIYQLTKYFIYVVSIGITLEIMGLKLTILLAGATALLVGLGLGLQQIFNDAVSGLLLLFESSVSIGDIVQIDGLVGQVKKINIRTSQIETRDNIVIIVPNSKLVSENVINWSHNRQLTRFSVKVGVKYGSDVDKVIECLEAAAKENSNVSNRRPPQARLTEFGDSSINFELLFWTYEMFMIEFVRSDIRIAINKKFNENDIVIPFPQRDLHIIDSKPTSLNPE